MRAVHTAYPPATPQIDVSSLTAGLIDVILPIGGMMVSLAGSLEQSTFVNTSAPKDAVNFRYKAPVKVYDNSVTSCSIRSSAPAPLATSQGNLKECAMVVLWRSDNAVSATRFCFGYGNSGSATPIYGIGTDASALHLFAFLRDAAGLNQTTSGALTLATNTDYLIVFSHSEKLNFHRIYANGVLDLSTTATTLGNVSFDRTTLGALQRNTLANAAGGQVALALTWNRALTPSEAIAISANPWQIFANPAPRPWGALAASGGVTFNPGWATGATRTIGGIF